MASDFDTRIGVRATERDAVNASPVDSAKGRATLAAKLQAESLSTLIRRQQLLAGEPLEFVDINLGIS